jgi:hypothetical protein
MMTSRLILDPIKPLDAHIPKTSESPKALGRKLNLGNKSPSPQREAGPASIFGGKSSGFESYRTNVPAGMGPLDIVKQRLVYEWKNIYRTLSSIDIDSFGKVSAHEF